MRASLCQWDEGHSVTSDGISVTHKWREKYRQGTKITEKTSTFNPCSTIWTEWWCDVQKLCFLPSGFVQKLKAFNHVSKDIHTANYTTWQTSYWILYLGSSKPCYVTLQSMLMVDISTLDAWEKKNYNMKPLQHQHSFYRMFQNRATYAFVMSQLCSLNHILNGII